MSTPRTPSSDTGRTRTDPLLNGDEVAEVLGCTSRTVRTFAARGELPRVVLGARSTRYRASDVEAFIERRTVTPQTSEAAPPGGSAKTSDAGARHDRG